MTILERIRWANVARLALAIAAGVLIAMGPHGCGRAQEPAEPLPRGVVPPTPSTVERRPSTARPRAELPRPRPRHHRRRRRRAQATAPTATRSTPAAPRAVGPPISNEGARPPAAPRAPAARPRSGA